MKNTIKRPVVPKKREKGGGNWKTGRGKRIERGPALIRNKEHRAQGNIGNRPKGKGRGRIA